MFPGGPNNPNDGADGMLSDDVPTPGNVATVPGMFLKCHPTLSAFLAVSDSSDQAWARQLTAALRLVHSVIEGCNSSRPACATTSPPTGTGAWYYRLFYLDASYVDPDTGEKTGKIEYPLPGSDPYLNWLKAQYNVWNPSLRPFDYSDPTKKHDVDTTTPYKYRFRLWPYDPSPNHGM